MHASIKLSLAAPALCSFVLGLSLASLADAASFQKPRTPGIPSSRDEIVVVTGVIQAGDHERFIELLDRVNPDIVAMDGPGGLIEDALIMAEEIHHRGLKTLVGPHQVCISACAIMFLSGRDKYAGDRSGIGLHAAADINGNVIEKVETLIAEHLAHFGVPADIVAKMGRIKPSDIWWLGEPEREALAIRFVDLPGENATGSGPSQPR